MQNPSSDFEPAILTIKQAVAQLEPRIDALLGRAAGELTDEQRWEFLIEAVTLVAHLQAHQEDLMRLRSELPMTSYATAVMKLEALDAAQWAVVGLQEGLFDLHLKLVCNRMPPRSEWDPVLAHQAVTEE